jgi:hypothetical protein
MPKTRGREGGKAQGIGTRRRREGLSGKGGTGGVTNTEGRYLNTDHKTGLIDRT